ncbi:MAG: hypothetical protein DRI01_00555 [Chloroflexi bacterium]|nr:MAG: hypothetical protein DRI01_00555 [Chloroflexota bacterium]
MKSWIVDNKIFIRCPACIGADKVRFYRKKGKTSKFVCKYCKNTKQMALSDYLELINEPERRERVLSYESNLKAGGK